MTANHALRAQLERARHLQATTSPVPPADTAVLTMPSGVERLRRRAAEQRLPAAHPRSLSRTAQLTAGRLKLASELRESLGFSPGTKLVVTPSGPQLLVGLVGAGQSAVGAPVTLDATGRLQLSTGQCHLLGVPSSKSTVLLFADTEARTLRIVDPARIHALLDELTPLMSAADTPMGGSVPDEPTPPALRVVPHSGAAR